MEIVKIKIIETSSLKKFIFFFQCVMPCPFLREAFDLE
jgi:hypothetical protein